MSEPMPHVTAETIQKLEEAAFWAGEYQGDPFVKKIGQALGALAADLKAGEVVRHGY